MGTVLGSWYREHYNETWASIKHGEFTISSVTGTYNRINFTKSLASGEGNVSEPRLISRVGLVREVACA
jgi:hypothetical protein